MNRPEHPAARWQPSLGLLALALMLVVAAAAAAWLAPDAPAASPPVAVAATQVALQAAPAMLTATPSATPAATPVTTLAGTPADTSLPAPRIPRQRDPAGDQSPDLADYVNDGERPSMAEVIRRLHQAGVHTGLGAFSPPGTRPPLVGLAVPEDFPLPAGYVRHYQATDDGQRIEPILMFAPDVQLVDAARQPVAMPADRVVPPALAPPGLPIRQIVIPAAAERTGG